MKRSMNRRAFSKAFALAAVTCAAAPSPGAPARKLQIGHTCITWGAFPRAENYPTLEPALKDISAQGFWAFETFPEILEDWEQKGTLAPLIEKYNVPLRSGYITPN